jgi:hypothetical protein
MRWWLESPVGQPNGQQNRKVTMTPADGNTIPDTTRTTCAHASCKCRLADNRPYGDYCSEYCKENAELTELRCQCEDPACR